MNFDPREYPMTCEEMVARMDKDPVYARLVRMMFEQMLESMRRTEQKCQELSKETSK